MNESLQMNVTSAKEVTFTPVSVHSFVREQNYTKTFQALFIKLRRIMKYCYGRNPFHSGTDPIKMADWQPFWIFDIKQIYVIVGLGGGMRHTYLKSSDMFM